VTSEQWAELLHSLKEHASIDYAYRRAVEFAERAKKPLYAFPPSSERDALLALPDYVLSRDR
jgi:geranylgeranyl pyrophosphate synthase